MRTIRFLLCLFTFCFAALAARAEPPSYERIVADCNARGITLVVWVRQRGEQVPGCRSVSIDDSADIPGEAVVIRRPGQERIVLSGRRNAASVLMALQPVRYAPVPCRT